MELDLPTPPAHGIPTYPFPKKPSPPKVVLKKEKFAAFLNLCFKSTKL